MAEKAAPSTPTPASPVAPVSGARALLDAGAMERLVDRVVTKRLRPVRDDSKALRGEMARQIDLRVQAEMRAATAEDEAAVLHARATELAEQLEALEREAAAHRVRVAELENRVAELTAQPTGLFRRRRRVRTA